MSATRPFNHEDERALEAEFDRFRKEFECWQESHPVLWDRLDFVRYEGVRLPVVEETAPLILGKKCVELHDARWVMLQSGDNWHFAIEHDDLVEPVDLTNFKLKQVERKLSQKWRRLLDPRNPAR